MSIEQEKLEITKDELQRLLTDWSTNSLSAEDLHNWAEINYSPLTQQIGHGFPPHTQYAMGIILSQLDFMAPKSDSARFAIEFLNTTLEDFGQRLRDFVNNCFGPIDDAEFRLTMERVERWKSAS